MTAEASILPTPIRSRRQQSRFLKWLIVIVFLGFFHPKELSYVFCFELDSVLAEGRRLCATAAALLAQIGTYAAQDVAQRPASDDTQVRRLRVAVSALNAALDNLLWMTPSQMPLAAPPPARMA